MEPLKHQTTKIKRNGVSLSIKSFVPICCLSLGEDGLKQLNTYPDKLALQWLNEALCKTLNLKFSNQWLIFSVGLRLVAKICERHLGVCGEKMFLDF